MIARGRVELHLRCRVAEGRREEFFAFLREAIPFYESPGGIEIRLLQDAQDDHRFIELVIYDDVGVYERDQARVADDAEMQAYLGRWRALLVDAPAVEVYGLVEP